MTLITATAMLGALSTDALASGARATTGRPLSLALNADGSPRHIHGSFDARGYRLVLGKNGAPRFVKAHATRPTDLAAPVAGRPGQSLLTTALNPADASWSDRFDNVGLANAPTVLAVAISGSNLFVGGSFTSISRDAGTVFNNVAMWNGRGWHALGSGTNGEVDAVAVSGANVYVGGKFTSAGGAPASAVARFNAGWSALGAGVSNSTSFGPPSVNALAVSGTKLYVGGSFDNVGTTIVAHSIGAWDGTNWSALGTGIQDCGYFDTPNHCSSTPTLGEVDALLVSGSTLYAGGRFQYVGGTTMFSLAAWNGAAWSSVNGVGVARSGASGAVYALAANGGTLYVGGQFDHVGGTLSSGAITGGANAASVASLTGATWSALGTGANTCCSTPGRVDSLAFRSGRLYMGGDFTGAGGDGVPYLGQWDGTGWFGVGGGIDFGPVAAIVSSPAGVIALGPFTTAAGGAVTLNHIGLWTGTRWTSYGLGLSGGPGAGLVRVAAASNHTLYVGGGFLTAGSTVVKNVAQFDGTSWSSMAGGVSGAAAQPYAIAINGKNVYVGGSFTAAGTVPASNIAMWDGAAWHALVAAGGNGVDGAANALLFYNGKLWVGGAFFHAGGVRASGVATWDPVAQKWAPVGGDLNIDNGNVDALTGVTDPANAANNHFVIIGGDFNQVDDGASPTPVTKQVNGLLIFDTTATIAKPFDGYGVTPGTGGTVGVAGTVAALYADGLKIYVGGSFGTAGSVSSRGFALYDMSVAPPNGWSSPGAVGGGSGTVSAITKAGSSLYLAGDFTTAGSVSAADVAQYTPTTHGWAALGSGLGNSTGARTLASSADGLYVGGTFGLAGAKASESVALWTKTAFPLTVSEVASPASAAVDSPVTFTATVKNTAATSATGVVMSESLPGTVQFVSASPSQGTCTRTGYSLSCAVGTLAAGASATVAINVIPVYPAAVTNVVTVSQSGSTNTNTATATSTATAQPATSYAQVRDTGVLPSSLLLAPGQTVQFDFWGPSQHSAKDGSPLALFDSGAKLPVSYYSFRYTAAGTYPVLDVFSVHTTSVGVHDTLSTASTTHGTAVTVTMSAVTPASGYALDLQVLLPGATIWSSARSSVTTASTTYTPALAGTYQLRSRLRNVATNGSSAYSPPVSLSAT